MVVLLIFLQFFSKSIWNIPSQGACMEIVQTMEFTFSDQQIDRYILLGMLIIYLCSSEGILLVYLYLFWAYMVSYGTIEKAHICWVFLLAATVPFNPEKEVGLNGTCNWKQVQVRKYTEMEMKREIEEEEIGFRSQHCFSQVLWFC